MLNKVITPKKENIKQHAEIPLPLCCLNKDLMVAKIQGGKKVQARLRDLGINPGSNIQIRKNDFGAPLIIAAKSDSRIALGRGMAQKIFVLDTH